MRRPISTALGFLLTAFLVAPAAWAAAGDGGAATTGDGSAAAAAATDRVVTGEAAAKDASQEQQTSPDKFSGLAFGDLYVVGANHDADLEGQNGLWFRRVYFTYDRKLDDAFDMRLRLEMNSPGDFKSSAKLEPFVKDMYLRWKRGGTNVYLGLSSTPTWGRIEGFWGYRDVEKTPLDLHKYTGSRDIGVAVKGTLGDARKVRYHVMVANGEGTKSERNEGKSVYGSLAYQLTDELFVEVYGDYHAVDEASDKYTWQVFAGYDNGSTRIGALYARQTREFTGGAPKLDLDLGSVFIVQKLSDRARAVVRLDRMFDPDPSGDKISYLPFDPTARSTLLIAGVDLDLGGRVHLIPNVEYVAYDPVGEAPDPDDDLMARLTFSWKW